MRLHVPYDSRTMLQTSWIVRLRSSRITSRTFATFSAIVLIEVRPERSSSSSDFRPFLNRLNQPKRHHQCLFYNFLSFCRTPAKFEIKLDANTLLLHALNFKGGGIAKRHRHHLKTRRSKECVHSALPGTTYPY